MALDKSARKHRKNTFGFKCKIYHLTKTQGVKSPQDFLRRRIRNGWKIIYLNRTNALRHALSNYFAEQRKYYHIRTGEEAKLNNMTSLEVDCDRIVEKIKRREDTARFEQEVIEDNNALWLNYENDLLDSNSHQTTANRVFEYLGLHSAPVETSFVRTNESNLNHLVQNFDELKNTLIKNDLSHYLND